MATKIKDGFEFNLQIALLRDSINDTQERLSAIMEYINANMRPPVTILDDAPGKHKPSCTISTTVAMDEPDSAYVGKAIVNMVEAVEEEAETKTVTAKPGAVSGD